MGRLAKLSNNSPLNHPLVTERSGQIYADPLNYVKTKSGEEINRYVGELEPNLVYYKMDSKPYTDIQGEEREAPIHFVGLKDTPMGDWDFENPEHKLASSITIENAGDAVDRLSRYVSKNPKSLWELYLTPGGVRAWELGQRKSINNYALEAGELGIDPNYIKLGSNRRPLYGLSHNAEPSFWSRVSGKPSRINNDSDFVALYLGSIGGKDALRNPLSDRLVEEYHDTPIEQYHRIRNLNPIESAENNNDRLLTRNIQTLPIPLRQTIRERYQL